MDFALMAHSCDMGAGAEVNDENNMKLINRPRLDTVSTMAPSPCASFADSPSMTPRGTDTFIGDFSLDAEEPLREATDEDMNDPVSRVNSPAHKVARLTTSVIAPDMPLTPRVPETSVPGTPRTPKPRAAQRSFTPPALVRSERPVLMRALRTHKLEQVSSVLKHSPDLVNEPFWEHDCETPLCFAIRLRCSLAIVQLLIDKGATDDSNGLLDGYSPVQVLYDPLPWVMTPGPAPFANSALLSPAMPSLPAAQFHFTFPQAFGVSTPWHQEVSDLLRAKRVA